MIYQIPAIQDHLPKINASVPAYHAACVAYLSENTLIEVVQRPGMRVAIAAVFHKESTSPALVYARYNPMQVWLTLLSSTNGSIAC